MLRYRISIQLILAASIPLIIAGCITSALPAQQTPVRQYDTSKVYDLKFGTYTPPVGAAADSIREYKRRIEERTAGRVKISLYFSEALGKVSEEVRMVQTGICDFTMVNTGLHPDDFPLCGVSELPFVMPTDRSLVLLNALYERYFSKEWKGVKIMFPTYIEDLNIFTTRKPVESLSDMRGLQMRVPTSKAMRDTARSLGATPVSIPSPETYAALEKGMVDGEIAGATLTLSMKKYNIINYASRISLNYGIQTLVYNEHTWESLPGDIRQSITDLNLWAQKYFDDRMSQEIEAAYAKFKESGVKVVVISPEERDKFIKASKPVVDSWVRDMDSRGFPASTLIHDLRTYTARN
jgi:TRAP-type transport system periplasmic protein